MELYTEPFWSTAATLDIVTLSCPVFLVGELVMQEPGLVLSQAVLLLSSARQFQESRMDTYQLRGKETIAYTVLSSMVVIVGSGWLVWTHSNARLQAAGSQMHFRSV